MPLFLLTLGQLGSIPFLPAQSCKEINANEDGQAVSSDSWLDPTGSGEVILAYCEMNTEGLLFYFVRIHFETATSLARYFLLSRRFLYSPSLPERRYLCEWSRELHLCV